MVKYQYGATISIRISHALKQQLQDIASEHEKKVSDVGRDALMDKVATTEDVELSDTMETIVESQPEYRKIKEKMLFYELENERINESYKAKTFLGYVDKSLASMLFELKEIYTDDELVDVMCDHLESFMPRAEFHDVEDRIEDRLDDPLRYAKDKADELRKQNQR